MVQNIETKTLARLIDLVKPAIPRTDVGKAAQSVLLTFEGDEITVEASNGEFYASAVADDGGHCEPAQYLISAAPLASVLRACGETAQIRPEPDGRRIEIRSGRYRTRLLQLAPEDFLRPPMLTGAGTDETHVSSADLTSALDAVGYAASTDLTRQNLCGVRLEDGHAVATDGHRLAVADLPESFGFGGSVTIPGYALRAIRQVAALGETTEIYTDDASIGVRSDTTDVTVYLQAQLIHGSYPTWSAVVPDPTEDRVLCDREDLLAALTSVAALRPETSAPVRIESDDGILLTVFNPDAGEATVRVQAQGAFAEPFAVNLAYLTQALKTYTADTIALQSASPTSPLRLDGAEIDPVCVVMPMRV